MFKSPRLHESHQAISGILGKDVSVIVTIMLMRCLVCLVCMSSLAAMESCDRARDQSIYITVTKCETQPVEPDQVGQSTDTPLSTDFDIHIQFVNGVYDQEFLFWSNRENRSRDGAREKNFETGWADFQTELREILKSQCDVDLPDQSALIPKTFCGTLEHLLSEAGFRAIGAGWSGNNSWNASDGTRNFNMRHVVLQRP